MEGLIKVPWQDLTSENISSIETAIAGHEHSVADIDGRVNELLRQINVLRVERQGHLTSLASCRGILSAGRRLSIPVLAAIIQHCVRAGWWRAPHVLGPLNSAWWQASRFARVWSTMYLDAEDEDGLARTRFWLRQAQGCALDITLKPSMQEHATAGTMRTLHDHGSLIRRLSIDSSQIDEVEMVLAHCPPRMERLRAVEIATLVPASQEQDPGTELGQLHTAFSSSTVLTSLSLSCNTIASFISFPSTIHTLVLHLNPISLNLISCTQHLVNVVFPALPLLVDFSLEIVTMVVDTESWPIRSHELTEFTLDHLHTLRLHVPASCTVLLDKLICPTLHSLTLSSPVSNSSPHEDTGLALISFLARSAPPLELLVLHDVDIPNPAFASSFPLLPSLRELRLHWSDISVETLALLGFKPQFEGLCPLLSRLDLRWCSHLEGGVLVDLVRQRNALATLDPAKSQIEEVAVLNCPFVEEGDVLEIAAMTVCRVTLRRQNDPCRMSIIVSGHSLSDKETDSHPDRDPELLRESSLSTAALAETSQRHNQ